MSRITYQTDQWGPEKADHLEISYNGVIVFITITDEGIDIHGQCSIEVETQAVNKVMVRPMLRDKED